MGKVIRIIPLPPDNCLFLYGLNKSGELVFRASRAISYLQNEMVTISKGVAYTNLYHFSAEYLKGLPVL